MATTIVTKYGSDAPAASDIVRGELAVDTENGRLYTENAAGAVVEIGLKPEGNVDVTGTVTADTANIGGTIPASPDGVLAVRSDSDSHAISIYEPAGANENWQIGVDADGDLGFYNSGSTTAAVTVNDSNNVGIGTNSPTNVSNYNSISVDGTTGSLIDSYYGGTLGGRIQAYSSKYLISAQGASLPLALGTNNTERMRIDASGNVGIGTASPDSGYKLDVAGNVVFGDGGGFDMNVDGTRWQFSLGGSEKMRLDSSGNLMVGKTSADNTTAGTRIHPLGYASFTIANDYPIIANRLSSDGDIAVFRKDGTTVGSIGTTSTFTYLVGQNSGVAVGGSTAALIPVNGSGSFTNATYDIGNSTYKFQDLYLSGVMAAGDGSASAPSVRGTDTNTGLFFPSGGVTAITRNGVEGCRMDASGNFLVGKSSTSFGTDGFQANADGQIWATNASASVTAFNRRTTDGAISVYYKDGTTVGSIGTANSGDLYIGNDDTTLLFAGGSDAIIPRGTAGASRDAAIDLGSSNHRFKDLYRSGSTISTSDRNMKQDERDLTEAETRVAQECKGLLKAFRFIDAVQVDGDGARIHFGIVAQDLQAAFEAEGLDATNYAMFRPSTSTDENGNEHTRLGVCYENLLAFIIAAI